MAVSNQFIFVKFTKEGVHCYPAAATDPKLESVRFLADMHRHIFHFKVHIEVTHMDRDIEFIIFKRWLQSLYSDNTLELNNRSCEMLANELHAIIHERYPHRDITIEVSEDDESGAVLSWKHN